MNRFVLIGLFFLLALGLRAQSVSENDARKAALAWMNSISDKQWSDFNISKITVQSEERTPLLYVVHFEPEGWVMVSASETVNPILGYSQTGRIDWDNLPEQVSFWVEETSHQIKRSLDPRFVPSNQVLDEWSQIQSGSGFSKAAVASVGPLLSSKWDQGRYHNELCPADVTSRAGNGYVYAGCVATTLAQIMKFWNHPQTGTGSYSYTHANYGTQSVNFGQTTYNWASMPDVLTSQNSTYHSEVQKITYHAAVAVNMNFNPISSGANVPDAVDALEKYFKYSPSAFWISRDTWKDDLEWKNLLRTEIDRGRPVFYAGYNQAKNQGHAFVLDGYSGDYFHFNWGWGGTADGNFLIDVLNPSAYNFSYNQMIVAGIYPIEIKNLTYPFYENFEVGEPEQMVLSGKASLVSKAARTGSMGLSLGDVGFNMASANTATLTFKVPENATLSFWVKRNSSAGFFGNNQKATLQTSVGGQVVHTFFNGDYTDADWKEFTLNLSAYAGQELTFLLEQNLMYGAYAQYIYVDDVSIVRANQNLAPYVPSQPTPSNASASIPVNTNLRWVGGDPNGDSVSYQVFLSKTNPPLTRIDSTTATSVLPNLEYSTKYYWKVVASDGALSTSSPIWSFTTAGSVPTISTCGVSEITKTSAVVCGRIEALNNSRVFKQGISWSTNETDFSLTKNVKECPISDNPFHATIEGLQPFTKYYARSFAISNQGTALGNVVSFYSGAVEAVVSVRSAEALSKNSVRISGTVLQLNDTSYTARGVVWALSPNFSPNEAEEFIEQGNWTEAGALSVDVTDLPGVQTYYARLFVENGAGRVYTEEIQFETRNFSPVLNLDSDGSTGDSPNYYGVAWEQTPFGALADDDLVLNDPDGDYITKMSIVLKVKSNSGNDALVFNSVHPEVLVSGLNSDSLLFEALSPVPDSIWKAVLRNTYLFNNSDMPDTLTLREVVIWTSDAQNKSEISTAFLKVKAINDAPVCVKSPQIEGESSFGQRLEIAPGLWADSIDGCNLNASMEYAWQMKEQEADDDSLARVVGNEINMELVLDERFCGKWVRGVETVVDAGCGEENFARVQSFTPWIHVERATQTISAVRDTVVAFGAEAWPVAATSSAGFLLDYQFSNPNIATYTSSGIAFLGAGSTSVQVSQVGNACYLAAQPVQFQLSIEKANQALIVSMPDTLVPQSKYIKIHIESNSGLPLQYHSLTPAVAGVLGDSIEVRSQGVFELGIAQAGSENYWSLSEMRSFVVQWPLSAQTFDDFEFQVYPNPASHFFMLNINQSIRSDARVSVFALDGRLVLRQPLQAQRTQVELPRQVVSGVYLIEIQNGMQIGRAKLIVSKL
jgi:hypothetical protein